MLEILGVVVFAGGLLASIALHEVGHLVPAKLFGVRVSQYMVGFGPTLWSRRRGETEYGFKAIPMGGYIRMAGMFPPGDSRRQRTGRIGTMIEQARADALSEVQPGQEARAFYSLSVPRKLTVMAGGPVMNLLLSAVLFVLALSVVGVATPTVTVRSTVPCVPTLANPSGIPSVDGGCGDGMVSPAVTAGLRPGDVVVGIDGTVISQWDQIGTALAGHAGRRVTVTVDRGGTAVSLKATLATTTIDGVSRAFLGVSPTVALQTVSTTEALTQMGSIATSSMAHLATFPAQVVRLAVGLVTGTPRDPQGPVSVVGVGRISGEIAAAPGVALRDKVSSYLGLLASMNLFLFLFNLLPLLPLDGGHIAGALYEGARRSIARLRGRAPTGPVDTARMLPLAYAVTVALLLMSLVVMVSDIVEPITLR